MIRIVFVGPDRTRTFELFRRVTEYPREQNENPCVVEFSYRSKNFEVWCTNGDSFEEFLLHTKDAVYVAVVEFAYAEMHRPAYVQKYGQNLYVAALDGAIVSFLDTLNQRFYVDAQFSSLQCLLQDIAMKHHDFRYDVTTEIRAGRMFCIDNTAISASSLCVWMNYMSSFGSSIVRISSLNNPAAAALALRQMAILRICVVQGDVAIVPHFTSGVLRAGESDHSVKIYNFEPQLTLVECLSRMLGMLNLEAAVQLDATRSGVYYVSTLAEIRIEADCVTIGASDPAYLSELVRTCINSLRLSLFSCYCNVCHVGVLPRHDCNGRIEQYGYPLNKILSFIRQNTMQCDSEMLDHIAIVKPRDVRVKLFDGGDWFDHFEANRLNLHVAYVNGRNLVMLEPNFRMDDRYNVWVQGQEYECVDGVLQNFATKPMVLQSSVSGYLSLPYAIPCLSSTPPPYPALYYTIGFVSDTHNLDYYVASNATVYKLK